MKLAIIGSRGLFVDDIEYYIPEDVSEIVSGGAAGIDRCAEAFARKNGIPFKKFLPDYRRYQKGAPLKRNELIIDYADEVLALWDGSSRGTKNVIEVCKRKNKTLRLYIISKDE